MFHVHTNKDEVFNKTVTDLNLVLRNSPMNMIGIFVFSLLTKIKLGQYSSTQSEEEEGQQQYENKANKNAKPNKRKHKEKVEEEEEEENEEATICRFPMNGIKRIMKTEDSRMALPQDVVFLVNKAMEKFCEDGYKSAVKDKKKSLSYKHLSTVVHEQRRYDFLSDYVPEDALKERNLTEADAE